MPLINDTSALTGDTSVDSLTWENQRYSPAQMKQLIVGHPIFTDLLVKYTGCEKAMVRGMAIPIEPQFWGIGGVTAAQARKAEIDARAASN